MICTRYFSLSNMTSDGNYVQLNQLRSNYFRTSKYALMYKKDMLSTCGERRESGSC